MGVTKVAPVGKIVENCKVYIDNATFRLHHQFTFWLLVALSITGAFQVCFRTHNEIITCTGNNDTHSGASRNQYCWSHSTYTIPATNPDEYSLWFGARVSPQYDEWQERHYHTYYRWVWCVLFFQALLFCVPFRMWKRLEGGRMGELVSVVLLEARAKVVSAKFDAGSTSKNEKSEKMHKCLEYFNGMKGNNGAYFYKFFFCEVLNFLNIIVHIYFTDAFLGNGFIHYGADALMFQINNPNSDGINRPMESVFPTFTFCDVPEDEDVLMGDTVYHVATCILTMNFFHKIIYLALWFWFLLVLTFSAWAIVFRLLFIFVPFFRALSLVTSPGHADAIRKVVAHYDKGDVFILSLLGNSVDEGTVSALLTELAHEIKSSDEETGRPRMIRSFLDTLCNASRLNLTNNVKVSK